MNSPAHELARLLELDGKRTQGKWKAEQFAKAPATEKCPAIDSFKIRPIQHRVLGSIDRNDALFVESAPEMIQLLRWYDAKLRQAREALAYAPYQNDAARVALAETDPGKPVCLTK